MPRELQFAENTPGYKQMVMPESRSGHSSFNCVKLYYTIKNTRMWSFT